MERNIGSRYINSAVVQNNGNIDKYSDPNTSAVAYVDGSNFLMKYDTYEALEEVVTNYIYFYNHERYQKWLNGFSPAEFRAQAA